MKYLIMPGKGIDVICFGMNRDEVSAIIGKPEETEIDTEEGFASEMWIYQELKMTLFFEGDETPVLVCIETSHPDAQLFDKRIFTLTEKEIVAVMQAEGLSEMDAEDEAWGERRVSFDDVMIDFYFENGKLNTINWSIVDDEEE